MKKLIKFILLLAVAGTVALCVTARLFPLHYEDEIKSLSEEYGVSASLIAAIIKTESNWNENAVSSAGAKGLMQITDSTFEWLVGEDGDIYDPQINMRCGAYYLSKLTVTYGDLNTVLAAYNAGSGNVDKWLLDSRYSSDGNTIDITPYGETNRYSKKIACYRKIYEIIYNLD